MGRSSAEKQARRTPRAAQVRGSFVDDGIDLAPAGFMKVGEICTREVKTVEPNTTLVNAVRRMRDEHIGALVVVTEANGSRVPVGVLTDRDIVVGVVATSLEDFTRLDVRDVATTELVTATEDEDLHTVLRRMRSFAVRRVPVVDDAGNLIGIIALDDILDALAEQMAEIARLVSDQRVLERERRASLSRGSPPSPA